MKTTAREYLRVSKGRGGRARSIDDQHTDNVIAEEEFGPWTWGKAYADTGSASKYARKGRDDFDRLMADLQSGEFGTPGDVLVLWEVSRLSRETGRGVALVDACEAGGYRIHITSHERTYNPANYNDRHALITGINDAEKEARLLSARTLRGTNSAAAQGRPHGPCHFGYARDYDVIDGRPRPVSQYEDPVEGPLVRELFAKVADGKAMYAVAKDWKTRGITSRNGVPFSPQTLRTMLRRVAYLGVRKHKGKTYRATWPALVDDVTFNRVQALLDDPSRRTYTGEGIKHALTSILRCDACNGSILVRYRQGSRVAGYECVRGCCRVNKAEVDRLIIGNLETGQLGVILAYLSRPDLYAALSHPGDVSEEEQSVRAQLASIRSELKELEDATPENLAEARMIGKSITMKEEQAAELDERLRQLIVPHPLAGVLPPDPGEDVVMWWEATEVTKKRALAALLLTPELLGEVRIKPSPVRHTATPVVDRIRWVTKH